MEPHIYVLAFDHRGSFEKDLFGVTGPPDAPVRDRISAAKQTIYDGFTLAIDRGAPKESCGVLVDEEFGARVARAAKSAGYILAMPVERSGRTEFEFEHADWRLRMEDYRPDFVKVLVRYNPSGDRDLNARQARRLGELSQWLSAREDMRFLFELLVPATPSQLADGGQEEYDRVLRPALVVRAIGELQDAGVEPDIWKIEGLYRTSECRRVAAQARRDGRDHVRCIVLGRGADEAHVEEWLRAGAVAEGFTGFAVGRTIWMQPLEAMLRGETDGASAAERIATNYLREIDVYRSAAVGAAT